MTVTQAAAHPAGQTLACPLCAKRYTCVGTETAVLCHNNHRVTAMRPVNHATSRERG